MTERYYKAEGLIIKTRFMGEADRVVTLLTKERGKFEAIARGARKTKSKLAAGVDIFGQGLFSFHRGRTWPVITGIVPGERFPWFREDPDLYPFGLYFAELINRFISGEEACGEFYELLLEGWRLLGKDVDRHLLCRAFELKLAALGGYCPELGACTFCQAENNLRFSAKAGGLVCGHCQTADTLPVGLGTLQVTKRLINTPLAEVLKLKASLMQKKELLNLTTAFYQHHLDLGELKTRRLLF